MLRRRPCARSRGRWSTCILILTTLALVLASGWDCGATRAQDDKVAVARGDSAFWVPSRPAPRFVSYLPDDCVAIVRVSLVELARHPASRPVYQAIKSDPSFEQSYEISAADVRDVMLMWHGRSFAEVSYRRVFFMRSPIAAETIKRGALGKSQLREHDGMPYGIFPKELAWSIPDGKTLVVDSEASLKRWFDRRRDKVDPPRWLDNLSKLSATTIAGAGDPRALFAIANQDRATAEEIKPLAPLAAATGLVVGMSVGERLSVHAIVETSDVVAAARIDEAATEALAWAKGILQQDREDPLRGYAAALASSVAKNVAPLTTSLLRNARITRADTRILVQTSAPFDVATCRKLLLLPQELIFQEVDLGERARREVTLRGSAQKLQPLVIAMHRYHRQFGHFPPAVALGPDGKTPHSWRIALLPFLGEQDLYEQYKLDQPWNSRHNRTLLEQAPDVLRGPTAKPDSVNTSYFVFTGDGTMFADRTGTTIDDVTDGASQTILIVETVRDVPWTKPEDIPFDPAKPFPRLGGIHDNLFLTTFVDGSTRGFPPTYDQTKLKAVVTKSGGEAVTVPEPPKPQ